MSKNEIEKFEPEQVEVKRKVVKEESPRPSSIEDRMRQACNTYSNPFEMSREQRDAARSQAQYQGPFSGIGQAQASSTFIDEVGKHVKDASELSRLKALMRRCYHKRTREFIVPLAMLKIENIKI